MSFDITILSKRIDRLKQAFETGEFADALVATMNNGQRILLERIFNENKDVEGNSFGSYVGKKHKAKLLKLKNKTENKRLKTLAGQQLTSYQRKRLKKGRQISKKDEQLTFGLRRSIQIVTENPKSVSLQFNTDEAAKIARGQEQQLTNIRAGRSGTVKGSDAVRVFTFNENEIKTTSEQGVELIKEILKS